ncbi:MAG TPA: hypothetical protein VHV27_06890 [Phenylobacterium sp.]|nr:hypothetical protein [Phenylobacterium sp.]
MKRSPAVSATLALVAALACATAADAQVVHPGEQEGLGLLGPGVPDVLKAARANPYALPAGADCPYLLQQVAALDVVLGPDLDSPQLKRNGGDVVMSGIRAVIPYGGVVRFVTGAGRRQQKLVNAALAGWERRGFLKGTARMMGCAVFGQPANPALAYPSPPSTPPSPSPPTGPR